MTTDPEEGRRQIEAMKPEPLKVGDRVRLAAAINSDLTAMVVVALEDYGNQAVCVPGAAPADIAHEYRETFPASALVRVDQE